MKAIRKEDPIMKCIVFALSTNATTMMLSLEKAVTDMRCSVILEKTTKDGDIKYVEISEIAFKDSGKMKAVELYSNNGNKKLEETILCSYRSRRFCFDNFCYRRAEIGFGLTASKAVIIRSNENDDRYVLKGEIIDVITSSIKTNPLSIQMDEEGEGFIIPHAIIDIDAKSSVTEHTTNDGFYHFNMNVKIKDELDIAPINSFKRSLETLFGELEETNEYNFKTPEVELDKRTRILIQGITDYMRAK